MLNRLHFTYQNLMSTYCFDQFGANNIVMITSLRRDFLEHLES